MHDPNNLTGRVAANFGGQRDGNGLIPEIPNRSLAIPQNRTWRRGKKRFPRIMPPCISLRIPPQHLHSHRILILVLVLIFIFSARQRLGEQHRRCRGPIDMALKLEGMTPPKR